MSKRKTLKELTIKDNFMFGVVMADENNCREFLEMVLGFPIGQIEVIREKSLVYHPEYKGIRLDIAAKDKGNENTHYNIEMQMVRKPALEKRVRYYRSQMDMELLLSGRDYTDLPDTYIIFICDFDPFESGKYCYTFENRCLQDMGLRLGDGNQCFFLNSHGTNEEEIPKALAEFLRFVKADLAESMNEFEDPFVKRLQEFISKVKESRGMEEKYMVFEEMLRDERAEGRTEGKTEGKAEAILMILETYGNIPEKLRQTILAESDLETLNKWVKLAVQTQSIEKFAEVIHK